MPMGSSPAHPFYSHQYVFAAKSWVSIIIYQVNVWLLEVIYLTGRDLLCSLALLLMNELIPVLLYFLQVRRIKGRKNLLKTSQLLYLKKKAITIKILILYETVGRILGCECQCGWWLEFLYMYYMGGPTARCNMQFMCLHHKWMKYTKAVQNHCLLNRPWNGTRNNIKLVCDALKSGALCFKLLELHVLPSMAKGHVHFM